MNEKFEIYHRDNPQIYKEFERFTLQTIQRGFQHYSSKGIIEIIRWHTGIFANKGFKVNNNYTPYYADLFEANHPQYKDFFYKRERKTIMLGGALITYEVNL